MITEFILNNRKIKTDLSPGMTLLDFIRYEKDLRGTKIGCREGDCGACTILIGTLRDGKMHYQSMTSCITPLGNARNKHVVTIEGLNMDDLTPVQQVMADRGGTQCGFCTVGFVVSLTCYCLTVEEPTLEGAVSAIDGNICRCTGYKSIERAAGDLATALKKKELNDPVPWLIKNNFLPEYFAEIPKKLGELNTVKPSRNGTTTIVGGGTDLYVQRHDEMVDEEIALLFDRSDLNSIEKKDNRVEIGSAATATDMINSEFMNEIFPDLWKHMKLVSSTPIRNMGTIAGNFVNASPIGDLTAFFIALNSTITLKDSEETTRELPLKDFYLDYKVINKKEDEIITKIHFDIPEKETKFNFEKVCKRTYLDIATVNSAIQIRTDADIITHINLSAGGVAPVPKYLEKTCKFLRGKSLTPELVADANEVIQSEISPISDVRGSADYKRTLLRQLFFAHFIELYPEMINPAELV